MGIKELLNMSVQSDDDAHGNILVEISGSLKILVYLNSINKTEAGIIFITKIECEKYLFILLDVNSLNKLWQKFEGNKIDLENEPSLK